MMTNYDPNDPRTKNQRVITEDGRFNYNRSFNVETLPHINGMPVLGRMSLEQVGVRTTPLQVLEKMVADNWAQYGVYLEH